MNRSSSCVFDMDLPQLEMFLAVAEEGSFTRAGERLHVSQSAVSRQIGLLERELGGRLFHRDGRRPSLTHAGELLAATASSLSRQLADVAEQISDVHGLRRGRLRLAGGMSICMYILPRMLKRYRTLHPDVDLRVTSGTSEDILRKLRSHEVDLALLTLPVLEKDLEVVPVLKEEMVVVAAPGHPLVARPSAARGRARRSRIFCGRKRSPSRLPWRRRMPRSSRRWWPTETESRCSPMRRSRPTCGTGGWPSQGCAAARSTARPAGST